MPRLQVWFALPAAAVAAGLLLLPAAAQPPLPAGSPLRYVPTDAALFVHADAAALWSGPFGEAVRKAAAKEVGEAAAQSKKLFGVTPDQLKTVTAFWPKVATPLDFANAGVVLTFKAPYDQAALRAGVEKAVPPGAPIRVVTKDATTAILLVNLPADFANPRPAADGPLAGYIREAAGGAHVLAVGVNPARLPAEVRGADLPAEVEPFRPLLQADSTAAFLDVGKEVALDVRVKSPTAMKAGQAEKALGLIVALAREGLDRIPAKEAADPAMKNSMAVVAAVRAGLRDAKVTTTGTEARARVAVPADLPLAAAAGEAVTRIREAAARMESSNNLKQIAIALINYADSHNGSLPPAAVTDKAGRPLLSWRVEILPYIEQQALYQKFKLDEPWDGPTNKLLLDKMPKVFTDPQAPGTKANETHYQVFVGKGAAFEGGRATRWPADFPDGTSNTILVATAAVPVPWTKPNDLAFDPKADMTRLLRFHAGVCPVAFADGSVRALSASISPRTLAGAITRAGGETLGNDF